MGSRRRRSTSDVTLGEVPDAAAQGRKNRQTKTSIRCPIAGCDKVFEAGLTGVQSHVTAKHLTTPKQRAAHAAWRPELVDKPDERWLAFHEDFPTFMQQFALSPERAMTPLQRLAADTGPASKDVVGARTRRALQDQAARERAAGKDPRAEPPTGQHPIAPPEDAPLPALAAKQWRFCPSCGNALPQGGSWRFCPSCGQALPK